MGQGGSGGPVSAPERPFPPTHTCHSVDAQGSCQSLYPALSRSDCGFPKKGLQRGVGGFRTHQDGSEVGFQAGEPGWGHLGRSLCPGAPPATQGSGQR